MTHRCEPEQELSDKREKGIKEMSESEFVKARMVKTATVCFISDCYAKAGYKHDYHSGRINNLYFDGKLPKPSFKKNWFVADHFPTTIQKKVSGEYVNRRWEINDKDMVSAKLPEVVFPTDTEFFDDEGNFRFASLYTTKYDKEPDTMEDVEIEWEMILDVPDFQYPPKVEFSGIHKWNYSDMPYVINNDCVKHQALDEMLFPEILLHNRPASFDSKTVYDITRKYILEHINPAVAKVSSNYDFCFEVKKLVALHAPETITYHNLFASTKREREKLHTTIKKYNEYTVFEMTHTQERYKGYTPLPDMAAESEAALNEKMNSWLTMLIEEINKPLVECPHCKGIGFALGEKAKAHY